MVPRNGPGLADAHQRRVTRAREARQAASGAIDGFTGVAGRRTRQWRRWTNSGGNERTDGEGTHVATDARAPVEARPALQEFSAALHDRLAKQRDARERRRSCAVSGAQHVPLQATTPTKGAICAAIRRATAPATTSPELSPLEAELPCGPSSVTCARGQAEIYLPWRDSL